MIKKIARAFFIVITICAIVYWAMFIKLQADNTMLNIRLTNNRLEIQTEQAAKYILVDTTVLKDTVSIRVYTTTTLNPFAEKISEKTITLSPNIKYIRFNDKTEPLSGVKSVQHY